jgi:hypothetical protein
MSKYRVKFILRTCLDFGHYCGAVEAFAWAWALHPEDLTYRNTLHTKMDEWRIALVRRRPARFPSLWFRWPPRRFPDTIPEVVERGIVEQEAIELGVTAPPLCRHSEILLHQDAVGV